MISHRTTLIFILAVLMFGCSKPGEHFVGRWSNAWTNGKLIVDIQRNSDNFLVRTINSETGRVIFTNSAKVQDGYLVMNEGPFRKLSYSESENAIMPVDSALQLPAFRRVNETVKASVEQSQANTETAIAQGITTYFEKNVPTTCDVKTSSYCAQSMEATKTGFILRGKANVPLTQLAFDDKSILVPCYLVKAAGAKLPTAMILEIKDDRGETRGYSGVCPAS